MSFVEATDANLHPPTNRQIQLVEFMAIFHRRYGRWPTQRAMASGLSVRSTNMGPYIAMLIARGLAVRVADPARRGGNVALTQNAMQLLREVRPRGNCSTKECRAPPVRQLTSTDIS